LSLSSVEAARRGENKRVQRLEDWETYYKQVCRLLEETEEALSPKQIFNEIPALGNAPDWLKTVSHLVYLRRSGVPQQLKKTARALTKVDDCYQTLLFRCNNNIDGEKDWQLLLDEVGKLRNEISQLPRSIPTC